MAVTNSKGPFDSAEKKERFLRHFRAHGNASKAARAVGIEPSSIYHHYYKDPEFAKEWDAAKLEVADEVEEVAFRFATGTMERPIIYKGAVTGTVMQHSERLAELVLKAYKPDLYREKQTDTTVEVNILGLDDLRQMREIKPFQNQPKAIEGGFRRIEVEVEDDQ